MRILTAFVLASLLLSSCVQEPESPRVELSERDQLSNVKNWFEQNKTKLRLPERGSNLRSGSQELILPFFEKEPDWEQFHHYYFPDGREVFEVNLESENIPIIGNLLDSLDNDNLDEVIIQNIMFVEHPTEERFDPIIVRYYPSNQTNIIKFDKINYLGIRDYWSGRVELFTYDERHFISFEFEDGKISNEISYSISNSTSKIQNSANFDVRCTNHLVPVTNCVSVGGASYCSPNSEDLVTVTSCSGSSGINYIYAYGGSSDYDGGTTIDPNGLSGGIEYYVPEVPAPTTLILNQLDHPCAEGIFKQLMKSSNIKSSIGNLNQSNAIIQLLNDANDVDFIVKRANLTNNSSGNTSTARTIDPNTGKFQITITFDNDYLNNATRLSIARTMIHETIHAFIVYNSFANPDSEFILGLYNYGATKGYSGNELHHNFMPQYVEAIGYSLAIWNSVYGNSQDIPRSNCDDLAWGGLTYSSESNGLYEWYDVFEEIVPSQSERLRIQNSFNNEASNNYAEGQPCN